MSTQTRSGIHGLSVTTSDPQSTVQSEYYKALQNQADQAVGSIYGVRITPISQAAVGGFNYIWENPSLNFNLGTYGYVNSRVVPIPGVSPGAQLTDPISTDYDNVLRRIAFKYSTTDQAKINAAQTAANAQATAVVSQYTSSYGPITQQMMQAVGVTTPIDYIIQYVVAQQWSCTLQQKQPPLSLTQMEQARDLQALLPCMPPSGANMLSSISLYLSNLSSVLPLQQLSMNANWLLARLLANTETPTTANGGMTTVDPNNGSTAVHVGYTINTAVTAIQNDLANTGRTLTINMSTSQTSQSTMSVNVAGSGAINVPMDWFMSLGGSASAEYNLYSFQGTGQSASVSMTFAGYSFVPVQPNQFQEDTVTGWFDASVIAQAVASKGQDVTGYYFVADPGYDFSAGGDFGMLNGVLIANFPTITINYQDGSYSKFMESFSESSSWDVRVFGIKIGSFSQSLYKSSVQQSSQSRGFTVTFTPSTEVLTVPDLQKQAYVIGGSVTYPGTGSH